MQSNSDDDKLDDLEERLKAARQEFDDDYNPKPADNSHSEGASIAYEFLSYVIAGGVLGYGVDYFFDTTPWGMMVFVTFGFIGAVKRANARTKAQYGKDDEISGK